MNMSELIKCTSLTKRFGSVTALDELLSKVADFFG